MKTCCSSINFRTSANNLINIEQPVTTVNEYGSPVFAWTSFFANLPAMVELQGASNEEFVKNSRLISQINYLITIRYLPEITSSEFGATLRIKTVNPSATLQVAAVKFLNKTLKNLGRDYIQFIANEGNPD